MLTPFIQKCFIEFRAKPLDALVRICVFAVGAVGVSVQDVTSSTLALLFLISLFHIGTWKRDWKTLSVVEHYFLAGLLLYTLSGFLSWFNNADHYEYIKQMGRYLRFAATVPVYLYLRGRSINLSRWLLAGVAVSGFVYLAFALHSYLINPDIPAASGYHHITFGDAAMLNAGIIAAMLISMRFAPWLRYLLIASMLCALYASILSQARGAWIAMPVYLVLFGIYSVRVGGIKKWVLALALFALLAALSPMDNIMVKRYHEATQEINEFFSGEQFDTSIGGRLAMWDVALDVWRENPLLGTGLGDYDNDLVRYQQAGRYTTIDVHGSVHNIYIQTLSTTGLFGFVAALFAIILLPLRLFMFSADWSHPLALAGIVLVVSYSLFGLSESWILRAPVVSMYMVYMAILASSLCQARTGDYRVSFPGSTDQHLTDAGPGRT
jgi:O-antigen ligase